MPHGYPPWSGIKKQTVFSLPIDMAELAVRLGSIVTHDRRGDVMFLESFEHGLIRWDPGVGSANSKVYISSSEARHGAYSVALLAEATPGGSAQIALEIPYPALCSLGVETHVYLPSDFDYFEITVYKYDGTRVHDGGLRYDQGATKLEYRDSSGNYQDLRTGVTLHGLTKVFTVFKLVADFDNDLYMRSLVNNYTDVMLTVALRSDTDPSTPRFRIVLELTGDASNESIAYVDAVIVTQNEIGARD